MRGFVISRATQIPIFASPVTKSLKILIGNLIAHARLIRSAYG
jgi:hypothetical protein